jgi:release factor glutamine methyltransferase
MLLRDALRQGLKILTDAQIPSPQLAVELLLMHAVGCTRNDLYAHPERELTPEVTTRYFDCIRERLTGKPTQYITGHQEFWGLDIRVTPDVLIPRPETEHVVETVLDLAKHGGTAFDGRQISRQSQSGLCIVDVGTGSGCIALALASELPDAAILAVDISAAALQVAKDNALRLGLAHRVQFIESDLLAWFLGRGEVASFDFVVSNPPYVGRDELDMVQREVKQFEPRLAWGGLENGDEVYRRLFPEAQQVLKPGGYVVVEIGYRMRDSVLGLLGAGWAEIQVRPDLSGIPRVVAARRSKDGK